MAYHRWTRQEALRANTLRGRGATLKSVAEQLNSEYGTDRTESKVGDAFRKGVIERALSGDPTNVFDRAPRLKAILNEDGSTTIDGNRPYSDEEMAEMFAIDMDEWVVAKRITNQWGKNFQTKLWWEPNELNMVANNWHEFLEQVEREGCENMQHGYTWDTTVDNALMYEMLLYDAHIGAKGWGEETGEDYDLYIAVKRYKDAFRDLLSKCNPNASRIAIVVGQDLFHFDTLIQGKGGATAKGTPQDVDTRWQKLFVVVCEMMAELISEAGWYAPWIDVIVQPGNHDTQTTFYLGEYLQAFFNATDRVRVDNTPKPRKYLRHGEVLLGFTHGDREKAKDLYGIMTEEAGVARWREWHRGHVHMEECSEDGTMRIRTNPALSGAESWHKEQGYRSIPGARAFLWHKESGIVRQEYYNVPWDQTHTDNLGVVLEERG